MATVRTWPPLEDGQEHENLAAFGAKPQERHAMAVLTDCCAHTWPSYRTWPPLATYGARKASSIGITRRSQLTPFLAAVRVLCKILRNLAEERQGARRSGP